MKNLRYIIIFGTTFILLLFILFYKSDYLGVYKDQMTVFYDTLVSEGYEWNYILSDNILEVSNVNESFKDDVVRNEWTFVPVSDGDVQLVFEYNNDKDEDYLYKIVYDLKVKGNKIYWVYGEGFGLLSYPNPY